MVMSDLQLNRAIHMLRKKADSLKSEQNRQYWLFTRTARGKPVDPKIARALYSCLDKIIELRGKLNSRGTEQHDS